MCAVQVEESNGASDIEHLSGGSALWFDVSAMSRRWITTFCTLEMSGEGLQVI